jgi:hypothetical protein
MKAEYEDEMLPEYDFSSAVRGKFAWTAEQREQIHRESVVGTARAWHEFALVRVQRLEAALFTLLVLGANVKLRIPLRPSTRAFDVRPSRAVWQLVRDVRTHGLLSGELNDRLDALVHECEWLNVHGPLGAEGNPAERRAHVRRLERIGREADALRDGANALIRHLLEAGGFSIHEIESKTEETAKLWLAA